MYTEDDNIFEFEQINLFVESGFPEIDDSYIEIAQISKSEVKWSFSRNINCFYFDNCQCSGGKAIKCEDCVLCKTILRSLKQKKSFLDLRTMHNGKEKTFNQQEILFSVVYISNNKLKILLRKSYIND